MINRIQKEAACAKRKQQIENKDKGYCFKGAVRWQWWQQPRKWELQQWRIVHNIVKVTLWEKCHWFHQNKLLLVQRQVLDFPCWLFMLYIFCLLFVLNTIPNIGFFNANSVHMFLAKCTMLYLPEYVHSCVLYEKMPSNIKMRMYIHTDNGTQCASCFFFKLLQTAYNCFKAVVSKQNMWITAENYNIFAWVLLTFLSLSLLWDIHFTWPFAMQLKSFGSVFTNHFPFKGQGSKQMQQTEESCFSWKPTEQQHHCHKLCEFGLKCIQIFAITDFFWWTPWNLFLYLVGYSTTVLEQLPEGKQKCSVWDLRYSQQWILRLVWDVMPCKSVRW